MQSYFRTRHYFPYTLEKLQNYLFIALGCSETMLAHQLHRQSASSDFLAVYSQRLVGPAKKISAFIYSHFKSQLLHILFHLIFTAK